MPLETAPILEWQKDTLSLGQFSAREGSELQGVCQLEQLCGVIWHIGGLEFSSLAAMKLLA